VLLIDNINIKAMKKNLGTLDRLVRLAGALAIIILYAVGPADRHGCYYPGRNNPFINRHGLDGYLPGIYGVKDFHAQ
jgi:hypothetical protein